MQKDQLYESLYTDYRTTQQEWTARLEELNAALDSLYARRAQLRDLRADQDLQEAITLLAETHKDGSINGKNAETRKLQAEVLLAHLRESDPEWIQLAKAIREVEAAIEDAEIRKEKALAQISFLRNQARMISGLANALGG
jgi:uncharacterized protein YukE